MTRAQGWALALASVASFMVVLDLLVVATALNTIRSDLGASIGQLEWTVNAYTLAFAVLLMTAAAVGDRFGRRRVFAIGLGVFAAGSAACALAPGAGALIAARTVQGTGAAMIMPMALALLNAAVPPQRRGWAMGIFGSVSALAVVVGPVLGGAITQGIAWQWIFWLNVPIGLLTIPLALRHLDESYGPRAALDLPGVALGIGAALGLVWGLVQGSSAGWASPEVAGALAAGVVLAVAFTGWELRARAPMLPMRLFAIRGFSAGNAVVFLLNASLTGTVSRGITRGRSSRSARAASAPLLRRSRSRRACRHCPRPNDETRARGRRGRQRPWPMRSAARHALRRRARPNPARAPASPPVAGRRR